jgi:hypothetical protein
MANQANQYEQKLQTLLQKAKELRDTFGKRISTEANLSSSYSALLARGRESRGEPNSKDLIKTITSSNHDARQAFAFRGPHEGMGKTVMRNLSYFGLPPEEALLSALLCIIGDSENSFPFLQEAKLPLDAQFLVVLSALQTHPVLDFEEFKTIEVMYQSANPDNANEAKEAQRRFEQARGRRGQHAKKHLLKFLPAEIKQKADLFKTVLQVTLKRDVFGSLDVMREEPENIPLAGLSVEDKLELLKIIASFGLGLASINLDLFNVAPKLEPIDEDDEDYEEDEEEEAVKIDPELEIALQEIFKKDVTAGSNLIGVYALEGMNNYPFRLTRIEPTLPRRISSADAIEYLRRGDAGYEDEPADNKKTYSNNEVAETVTQLQDREVQRFLEFLKWEMGRNWKSKVGEKKREILFADNGLKVRNIVFLMAYGLFDEEEIFENIFLFAQKSHPSLAEDTPKILLLSNRYYFLDILGLNPGLLYNRMQRSSGATGTLINEVSDFQITRLLHIGMSIYIKVGDAAFKNMPIAWNMLLGQCEGKIDQVFQEVGQLLDVMDTLLIILETVAPDLKGWVGKLLDALQENAAELPGIENIAQPDHPLRITTRTIISSTLETLNNYCVNALSMRAKIEDVTPISIIQVLKIDRSKSDKLRTLLAAASARAAAAAAQKQKKKKNS